MSRGKGVAGAGAAMAWRQLQRPEQRAAGRARQSMRSSAAPITESVSMWW